MAANSQSRGIASLGKRFVNQISNGSLRDPARVSSSQASALRGVHVSSYDKEIDDQVRPSVVPDHLIQPASEKYWAPHPQTGVFSPPEHFSAAGGDRGFHSPPSNGESSVLEQKAWFRPLEDVEKPKQF
ncbi:late embryogenesis abundant protein At5g17165-like isoform X2 [Macadamia integrifolia]|uniref:late embryogenesis abundant protein At5g17165-like isoform X2 n=1 Tax=Macadamia integrifolia TaxID=60698 RepID=UPI001C4E8AFD|nr:late embryogenesis abundant protein At5g17165-like isoform X2 [Macadamia integrifolia]